MFDYFSKIGIYHNLNQDYAFTQGNIGVISDGCSSVSNSDVGARILALQHANHLSIEDTLRNSIYTINSLGLNTQALFATLGCIEVNSQNCYVTLWGDGVIIFKFANKLSIFRIQHLSAPYYPLYSMYKEYDNTYRKEFGPPITMIIGEESQSTVPLINKYQPSFLTGLPIEDLEYVLIGTDGCMSFEEDILQELCDFKSINGQFVRRRLQSLFKKQWKNKLHHDDLTILGWANDSLCKQSAS